MRMIHRACALSALLVFAGGCGGDDVSIVLTSDAGRDATLGGDGGDGGDGGAVLDARADASADAPQDVTTGDAADAADARDAAEASAPCDPVAQTGCAPAEKCTAPPATCAPNGTIADGQTCGASGVDGCVRGDTCIGAAPSTCRRFCNVDADCTQPAVASGATPEPKNVGHCIFDVPGSALKVCSFACNPVTAAGASGCPAGLACVAGSTAAIAELTDCAHAGAVAEGGDCSASDCAPGLFCVRSGGNARCHSVCRAGTDADCPVQGDACTAPAGVTDPMFGVCCASTGC